MEQEKTIYETCSICKKEVIFLNIVDCPKCKSKVCLICKLNSDWKCPNCRLRLDQASSHRENRL